MAVTRSITFLLLQVAGLGAAAQELPNTLHREIGKPYVRNYRFDEGETDLVGQFFDVAQDQRGVMYFAGSYNIEEFDGIATRSLINQPLVISALAIDDSGRIYLGAKGDLGYLQPDGRGRVQFVSLKN